MSDRQPALPNRQTPFSDAFKDFIRQGWAPYPTTLPDRLPAAEAAKQRRATISRRFPGERLGRAESVENVRKYATSDVTVQPHSPVVLVRIPAMPQAFRPWEDSG